MLTHKEDLWPYRGQVARLIDFGRTDEEIAREVDLTPHQVKLMRIAWAKR